MESPANRSLCTPQQSADLGKSIHTIPMKMVNLRVKSINVLLSLFRESILDPLLNPNDFLL